MWTIFIGFMGSGKSTLARRVGAIMRRRVVDLDEVVAAGAGRDIPDLFRREGEGRFRAREQAALRDLPGDNELVLATGGGIVEDPEAGELLRSRGTVFWLDLSWREAWARVRQSAEQRPLVAELGEEGLRRLHLRRRPLYAAVADFRLRSDRLDQDHLARAVVAATLGMQGAGRTR